MHPLQGERGSAQRRAAAHLPGLAEEQGHHPDLCLGWGRVQVTLYTHNIDGLHENDFVLAAKIDNLPLRLTRP